MLNVKSIVEKLCKKYGTNSPYELCELMGITVTKCELGTIRGYYHHAYRVKQIFLNCNLSRNDELVVLSHELGHAVIHPTSNTPFFKGNTLMSVDKMEIEANKFSMELLIADDMIQEYCELTISQLSKITGYNEELIKLRLR